MAHAALHFAAGMVVGTAALSPPFLRRIASGRPVAAALGRLLAGAYALGVFAVLPGVLPDLGVPEWLARGWWMNLFVLHPLLDRLKSGGTLVGEILVVALFAGHYALVLLALLLARRRRRAARATR